MVRFNKRLLQLLFHNWNAPSWSTRHLNGEIDGFIIQIGLPNFPKNGELSTTFGWLRRWRFFILLVPQHPKHGRSCITNSPKWSHVSKPRFAQSYPPAWEISAKEHLNWENHLQMISSLPCLIREGNPKQFWLMSVFKHAPHTFPACVFP